MFIQRYLLKAYPNSEKVNRPSLKKNPDTQNVYENYSQKNPQIINTLFVNADMSFRFSIIRNI